MNTNIIEDLHDLLLLCERLKLTPDSMSDLINVVAAQEAMALTVAMDSVRTPTTPLRDLLKLQTTRYPTDSALVRKWAKKNKVLVNRMGKVSQDIMNRYVEAMETGR